MPPSVAAFTDTYLPTVNGVTYTISSWRDRWRERGGRMDVVYPAAGEYEPIEGEHPVGGVPFPFYSGYRVGLPRVPDAVRDVDVVHAHTPFSLGLAAYRLARSEDLPLVATYHTPTSEYADYVAPGWAEEAVAKITSRYERWFLDHTDLVLTPSTETREFLETEIQVSTPVESLPNGVDTRRFRPVHPGAFRRKHDLPEDRPIVGYTGRHGYEKRLGDIIDAAEGMDVTVVFGGDGPAREDLEAKAAAVDVDARFLGFLDREDLPAFYSVLDVFAFPSPVETQGLVALEANACGTPVVGVDAGALAETVDDGETGYHYDLGDVEGFRESIRRALENESLLSETCLERREEISVEHAIDRLEAAYERVR